MMRRKGPPVPTRAQAAILAKIEDGEWELGQSMTMDGWSRMQEGGISRGGATETVRRDQVCRLWKAKWIESTRRSFPTERFAITQEGRDALARFREQEARKEGGGG